ncbi:VanZ family protein [Streptomyces sp. RPA4-5]|uniref:VanZ family protein n=1 Tax=unclassified Streptomyces TaxID=2593676 RepID=UPI00143E134F|nr:MULTISPECIES: VanZ family protein [unclassified Streptomyces]QIY55390.1 VanZ family protein [Streptomyces sp. RPA4-5]WJY38112.1 VanZ family protein [Streptomyces sp. P9-2B-2]
MLEAVFKGHTAFIISAITLSLAFFSVAFLTAKKRTDRPFHLALWCTSMLSVSFLTLWTTGGSQGSGRCVVNLKFLEPFGTEQGLLNCLMFTPVGFLGVLVTRRLLPGFAISMGLSVAIETAQGALPVIGRACDTSDLLANSAGGLLGALMAFLITRTRPSELTAWRLNAPRAIVTWVAFSVIIGVVWSTSIQTHAVKSTEAVGSAGGNQREVAISAVHQAFGNHYTVGNVQFSSSPDSDSGTIMASLPVGFVQVNWPEGNEITASLDMSDSGEASGFPVPGSPAHIKKSNEAKKVATAYAEKHFPWALPGSTAEVSPVGDNAALGWMVSWRKHLHGVLMPMRLDVQIDRAGHVSQLSTRKSPDVDVPSIRVNKENAAQRAMHSAPGCRKAEAGELLAVQDKANWNAVWRILVTCKDSSMITHVNAHSGAVEVKEKHPAP